MTAEAVNSWANGFLIASLVVGVVSTYAIVVSGNIKERALKRELAEANVVAENAKSEAAIANQKTAALNARAVTLEKEAEVARLETEKLKKQFAWRRLSKHQLDTISKGLSKVNSNINIVVSAIASDPESMTFAGDIQLALSTGGRQVSLTPSIVFGKKPIVGIEISGPDKETIETLGQPFIDAGLSLAGVIKEKQKEVNILIGSKPSPVKDK